MAIDRTGDAIRSDEHGSIFQRLGNVWVLTADALIPDLPNDAGRRDDDEYQDPLLQRLDADDDGHAPEAEPSLFRMDVYDVHDFCALAYHDGTQVALWNREARFQTEAYLALPFPTFREAWIVFRNHARSGSRATPSDMDAVAEEVMTAPDANLGEAFNE